MPSILKELGLEPISNEDTLFLVYGNTRLVAAKDKLQKWLSLLPDSITAQIEAALRQERPFLPPDITPEMMATKNSIVPSMAQMDILYRCIDFAFQAEDYNKAACLAYVVDRATYWLRASKNLLQVVDMIKKADPLVAIAPQVQVRKARVLKDEGDLHGAMKVLNDILERRQKEQGEWKYVDEDQYVTTKAEIIKIKGHILYNMGMFNESVEIFLDSINLFASLQKKDEKGIASCLGLLTKCLGKLSLEEFEKVRQKFPKKFQKEHPCLESYVQGIEAVRHIESLHESLYSSRHMLDADTSLLKYAILSDSLAETYELLQTILEEMKGSLGAHKTIETLESSEQFFEFVRALFMISLALAFSPVEQDRKLGEYVQQLSIELYFHLCNHNFKVQSKESESVARLSHSAKSVTLMNTSLSVLGLPSLLGVLEEEVGPERKKSEENLTVGEKDSSEHSEMSKMKIEGIKYNKEVFIRNEEAETSGIHHDCDGDSINNQSNNTDIRRPIEQVTTNQEKEIFSGWTYNFGHVTRVEDNVYEARKGHLTFPLVNHGKLLDPKKQWQTYRHKCVGLPVDPNFFASPVPSNERTRLSIPQIPSSEDENQDLAALVNLSVPYIKKTLESKAATNVNVASKNPSSLVNREKTTVGSVNSAEIIIPMHPHDLPDQPMRRKCSNDGIRQGSDFDAAKFAPLVDLGKTSMGDVQDADVGKSTSSSSTSEYINSWQPPKAIGLGEGSRIQRAFVLNFNPTTSVWTSQSTLAFLGDELDLTEDNRGNCRDAFRVQFLHQDEPRTMYVGKRYRNVRHHNPTQYMQDVVCQMMARYYVTKFNEAMQNYKRDIQLQFLPVAHLQLLTPYGDLEDCINVEPFLCGDFIKLTNNFDFVNSEKRGKDLATALSHFSYCESKGTLMIVDIQGWLPKQGTGVFYLTDPQFHTVGLEKFSPYDHQEAGIKKFWESVHPHCNEICRAIGLERL
ncbi:alpha-protein kinase 1-like isoform X2 [Dendronephthya gigantea]|uniref:alpha-protein kinase 1-like isoform X2 n=1 Tax=Dendronephthya gigantea TaxID=151771 RepID=UPI00106966B1|nr:alpha-protein kinase 1-like isoform X2 [Dendronephthya gigantea]